jgi:hypothetical protein
MTMPQLHHIPLIFPSPAEHTPDFSPIKPTNMNLLNRKLQDQIDKMNQYSLLTYMEMLGYSPVFENEEHTVFDIPQDNGPSSTLIINNRLNRFRFSMAITNGGILDLASLLFRANPEDILADILPYRLDQLMSANAGKQDPQPNHAPANL